MLFSPFFSPVLIDLSGHKKNSLISHQISRAECDFSNPASRQEEVYDSESGSDAEDERRLPDVVLDDLAYRRFQMKKRPERCISKTISPNSCPQMFSPADPLATGAYKLMRSEKFLLDWNVYSVVDVLMQKVTPHVCNWYLNTSYNHLWPLFINLFSNLNGCYNTLTLF